MSFGDTLKALRKKAGKSRYRLAQYSGIDQAYIQRLETGERSNPSRDVVLMIGLALVENLSTVSLHDVDELLLAADYAPLRRRGERLAPAGA
jgi:transcriptional regulator with XRE-family HTH domain